MPSQLVKRLPLVVLFTVENGIMLHPRDRPLLFVLHVRPAPFRQDRPRQPTHVQGEVVEAAQIDVCGNSTFFQHAQNMIGFGFQQANAPDRVESLVFDCGQPAGLSLTFLELGDFLHDVLPGARRHAFVAATQVGASDLEIEGGLP